MFISFLGAVEDVTGSCHLIEFNDKKILLDCGQFQGSKAEEQKNFSGFGFNPKDIDYVLLSHSHIDHCGRIPLLYKRGFTGEIICTKPTNDLCNIMLLDSAFIHESEAEWENRKAKRAGKRRIDPLYTQEDAMNSLKHFTPYLYDQMIELSDDLKVRFSDAGHVLGSSIIEIWIKEDEEFKKIVFSGDLGVEDKPILNDPTYIEKADYVIIEATYGDRLHSDMKTKMNKLIDIILKTSRRGGNIVIPSFAVGRTQEIIYELNKFYDANDELSEELRKIPVYIDSPLATKATEIFKGNSQVFDAETRQFMMEGNNPLNFQNLKFVQSQQESKNINEDMSPKIIISASGMCEAGRIKHHLKHNLWREESSIVFVGYQAEHTLGRRIKDGEKMVKIFAEEIAVQAEIHSIDGFSGHADKDGLLKWLKGFTKQPEKIFIVHGERGSKEAFLEEVSDLTSAECIIPQKERIYEIGKVGYVPKKSTFKNVDDSEVLEKATKATEPADEKKMTQLSDDVGSLKKLFEDMHSLLESRLNDEVNVEEYNKINNQIIELENAVMNLSILTGK